ncbi:uncharacterized protein LOC143461041 isoform X2 [Clavelina lepadiformis]|uniref:uncharacterized protein LOC143461041 isoform X2 n=1 Tax=Clavelina lepadiformis TaxID=159417 RepID=UPI00404326B3
MRTDEKSNIKNQVENLKGGSLAEKKDEIVKLINNQKPDSPYLDLANRSMSSVPMELFILPHLKQLYLEGNILSELPDNFFDRLPALEWLDLRNNRLKSLPTSIGRHQCLNNLLLEGNFLSHLPLQLGMTKSLTGLSLRGNLLVMPPQHIVDQGVYVILSYLYQELQNRTRKTADETEEVKAEKLNISDDTASTSDEEILTEAINLTGRNIPSPMSDDYELVRHGSTPISASLNKPLRYQQYKGISQTSGLFEGLSNSSRGGKKELSLLHLKQQEDTRKEKLQTIKQQKIAHADQRRKDTTALEEWRNETRRRQHNKLPLKKDKPLPKPKPPYAVNTGPIQVHDDVREEKVEPVLPGPHAQSYFFSPAQKVSEEVLSKTLSKRTHLFVEIPNAVNEKKRNKAEKIASENATEKSKVISQVCPSFRFSKASQPSIIKKKYDAIQEKIKQHSFEMHNQLKKLRGKSNDSAGENNQQSRDLQRQLLGRKMSNDPQLEYRFRAFTGDSLSLHSGSNKTTSS